MVRDRPEPYALGWLSPSRIMSGAQLQPEQEEEEEEEEATPKDGA